MKITIHLGAHRTDDERLMKALVRNSLRLSRAGIFVPGPSRYRSLLRQVTHKLNGEKANPETLDLVLDSILDTTEAEHIVLSFSSFLCAAQNLFANGGYYSQAGKKCLELRNVFPGHKVRFALALRNPATQVPAVFQGSRDMRFAEFLNGTDPLDWSWLAPVADIRAAVPDCPLIVWCNEDTPLIWGDVIRAVADHPEDMRLRGSLDLLSQIMRPEGMERMKFYLSRHPPSTPERRRRIHAAFLAKYYKEEEMEEEIDLPGWDDGLIAGISEAYEDDVRQIAAMPGVTFLAP